MLTFLQCRGLAWFWVWFDEDNRRATAPRPPRHMALQTGKLHVTNLHLAGQSTAGPSTPNTEVWGRTSPTRMTVCTQNGPAANDDSPFPPATSCQGQRKAYAIREGEAQATPPLMGLGSGGHTPAGGNSTGPVGAVGPWLMPRHLHHPLVRPAPSVLRAASVGLCLTSSLAERIQSRGGPKMDTPGSRSRCGAITCSPSERRCVSSGLQGTRGRTKLSVGL